MQTSGPTLPASGPAPTRSTFAQIPLASVEWDGEGRVTRWSPEAEALFGWHADEVMGRRATEWPFVHPDDDAQVRRVASDLREARALQTFSANRNLTRDGRVLHCEWYNTAVVDAHGRTQAQLSLVLDVTERVRAERAADRTRRLQSVTEALSEALTPAQVLAAVMDHGIGALEADAGVMVLLSADGEQLELVEQRGYPPSAAGGWERFPLAAGVPIAEAVRRAEIIIVDSPEERDRKYPLLSGQQVVYPVSLSVPLIVEGRRLGAMGLGFRAARDFPDDDRALMMALARQCAQAIRRALLFDAERAARRAAEESEEQFRTMAESIPQLAWMADAQGALFWYNQRWYDYTGTDFGTMQGWGWRTVHHPDHVDRVTERYTAAVQAEVPWEDTFPLRGHDGRYRRFLSRALPLRDAEGRVVRWFGTNTDVEEQLRAEEARAALLEEAQAARGAAEEANRAKSMFLATMSHEIRTPINAVIGYAELLDMGIQGALNEGQRGYLARIRASSQHLLGLVNDVLDFAKIEAGEMGFTARRVELRASAAEAVGMVAPQAESRGVELREEPCPPGAGYLADPDRVRQILLNLLSNAIKFTHPGGTITVRCVPNGEPPGQAAGAGPWACIEVRDTGIGIAAEQLARIFEPFTQVDGTHTREAGGTGLGLAISRRFARLMGGELTARSQPGEGSAFFLWLPTAPAEEGSETVDGSTVEDPFWPAAAGEVPGLREAGRLLEESPDRVVEVWVRRIQGDPGVPGAHALDRARLEDHTQTLVLEIGRALTILDTTGGAPLMMRDGENIQRTLAQLHGLQRARLGFAGDEIRREYAVLLEEMEALLHAHLPARAPADPEPIAGMIRRMMGRVLRVALESHASLPDDERRRDCVRV
ncbi:PAS domain S-box protein [Longimicrobium sp.]|uniref:PAS domain S-box protein n=1 Tax=Longimicrobium sp. TaxID=2029185 RepID=UPI003B3B483B